ncbi:tyrosine-type recombinase/integrase [Gracilibacillus massiliensis]|uniref:tyrosine-type recombinase/integrase n=1 Tax=Gracilibacillus massiliensis TaxID=1564956 RepID=UPI00071C88D5|nr:tyrosine-type recombinase/integrase [Gracilibacillus massiliensis]
MEFVHPIRTKEQINQFKSFLKKKSARDYLLFVLEINTGMRINDLLTLKVHQVWDGIQPREFLSVSTPIYLNTNVYIAIDNYLSTSSLHGEDYLFRTKNSGKPITRQQAYRIINHAAREIGMTDKVGIHTLRKTFGYHAYKQGIAISLIRDIYGHSSTSETLHYIGLNNEMPNSIKIDINL